MWTLFVCVLLFLPVEVERVELNDQWFQQYLLSEETILQITSKTYIYCISEEHVDAAMFTVPPLNKSDDSIDLMNKRFWKNDDWEIKKSSDSTRTAVLDRRWEDFDITRTNNLRFDKLTTSVSFSVYGKKQIEFSSYSDETGTHQFSQPINAAETWLTYTIFQKNGSVYYYQNNDYNISINSQIHTNLVINTSTEAYFKIHDYEYREATFHNNEENSTTLIIPSPKISLLIIYVSLCKLCVLEVSYNGEKVLNISSDVKEHDALLEKWQSRKIMINSSISNEVTFVRKLKEPTEEGYWRLDVRGRNYTYDAAVFKRESEDEIPSCKYLQASEETQISTEETMVNPINVNCKVGFLGKTCSINCEDVLGEKYKHCENHKIWYNNVYECPWGYSGDSCDKECENGQYGFGCKQKCSNYCPMSCDKKSGECLGNQILENIKKNSVFILVGSSVVLVIIGVIICMIKK
ncbi:uncharacterized protein LOC135138840 [Zophobas morio]|uniref:uncharacterized protein LOC135138840 n=1 Tax=Zophobas morio TaxID=2755281 RepID=UPI003083CE1A